MDRRMSAFVAVLVVAAAATPALAQDAGTVSGTVVVGATTEPGDPGDPGGGCLLIGIEAIDFGMLNFGQQRASDPYDIVNCSNDEQLLLAQGTDASNHQGDVTWSLADHWTTHGHNEYVVVAAIVDDGGIPIGGGPLPSDPALLWPSFAGGETVSVLNLLVMPPSGDGAGQVMAFDIVYTAVVAAAN